MTDTCPNCATERTARQAAEKDRDEWQQLAGRLAEAAGWAKNRLEDHDSCSGRRHTHTEFPECGREFPQTIDGLAAALAEHAAKAGKS